MKLQCGMNIKISLPVLKCLIYILTVTTKFWYVPSFLAKLRFSEQILFCFDFLEQVIVCFDFLYPSLLFRVSRSNFGIFLLFRTNKIVRICSTRFSNISIFSVKICYILTSSTVSNDIFEKFICSTPHRCVMTFSTKNGYLSTVSAFSTNKKILAFLSAAVAPRNCSKRFLVSQ